MKGLVITVLILTGQLDAPYHEWRNSTPFLRGALEKTGRFEVKVIEEVRGITAATLGPYDVLILHYNGPRWGRETERAIEDFVRGGKGFLSFHGATYGEFYGQVFDQRWKVGAGQGWKAYADLVGATWDPARLGHARRGPFTVKWVDREHPIARGLPEIFATDDELYHRLDLKPPAHVLATAYSDPRQGGTGNEEPIIWTAPFGKGRTVHITLGHDVKAMSQPGFLDAFTRGAEWAATSVVSTKPPTDRDEGLVGQASACGELQLARPGSSPAQAEACPTTFKGVPHGPAGHPW